MKCNMMSVANYIKRDFATPLIHELFRCYATNAILYYYIVSHRSEWYTNF